VHVGEAIGLLYALNWMHALRLGPVDFELDSKRVVDGFFSSRLGHTEFGDFVKHCKSCFSNFYNDLSVEFIRRQANEVAHSLAEVALFSVGSQVLVDIPYCIEHVFLNKML
jgi:ribonuclease HI